MKKAQGNWSVSIYADCPYCDEWGIDVCVEDNFWTEGDGVGLGLGECKVIEATCPECKEQFEVDLVW